MSGPHGRKLMGRHPIPVDVTEWVITSCGDTGQARHALVWGLGFVRDDGLAWSYR